MIFSILKEAKISCSFEKLSGVFGGLIFDIWECIFIMLMQVAVFSFAPGSESCDLGVGLYQSIHGPYFKHEPH